MSETFIHYLLIAFVTSLVFYCIGYAIFKLFRFQSEGPFTSVFLKLSIGCFSFAAICALYFTSLKTIFSGIIICLGYFAVGYWKSSPKKHLQGISLKKELLVIILFLLVTFIIYSYRFYSASYNGDSVLNIPNPDFTFYARISHFIVNSGVESATPTLVYPELNSVDPYHYFELWLNGGISHFSGGDNLQILFLVSYTLGISLVWSGFCALAEALNKINLANGIFAVFATFFIPLPWALTEVINAGLNKFYILTHAPAEYIDFGLWNMTKIYPVYLVFILAFLAIIKKEKMAAIAALSMLPLIYSTISIPILGALSVYILFDYIFISKDKTFFISSSILLLLLYIFIAVFYSSYLSEASGNELDPFRRLGVEPFYKSFFRPIKIFFDATFQLLILLLPFIVILILELLKYTSLKGLPQFVYQNIRHSLGAQLGIIVYCVSLAAWCVLFDVIDANQFFATSAIPMVNILCFIVVIHVSKMYLKVGVAILCVYFVNITTIDIFEQRLYSEEYMKQVEGVTKENGNIIGFLLNDRDYEGGYGDNIVEALGEYITLFRSDSYAANLSGIGLPFGKPGSDSLRQVANQDDFFRFVQGQQKENKFISIGQSRIDFIDTYNIDYLIASPHVELDTLLSKRVKNTITDVYSRQVLLLLNK